jgi:hypothetical protein
LELPADAVAVAVFGDDKRIVRESEIVRERVGDDNRISVNGKARAEGMTLWTGSRCAGSLRAEKRVEKNLGSQG